MVKLEILPS